MKRIIAAVLIFMLATALCSCGLLFRIGSQRTEIGEKDDAPVMTVNGETFKLESESSHGALHYKHNYENMNHDTSGSFCNVVGFQNGDVIFAVRLVYFTGKSINEVMSGSDYTLSKKTVNGLEYTYFEYNDNGMPGHTYAYNFDGTTYTISFASQYDMTSLEEVFLQNVSFSAE